MNLKLQKLSGIFLLFAISSTSLFSQTVTIDHTTERFVGDVSELDRSKFFTVHSTSGSDPELNNFLDEYNVTKGRGFWSPYSYAKSQTGEVGVYPAPKTGTSGVKNVSRFISTDHPSQVIRYDLDKTAAADWAVEYWKNFVTDAGRPEFYEPMNEPFVHAGDAIYAAQQPDAALMRQKMAEWYAEIGKKIHQAPELDNMKIIGYSSAWPSMELWDFGHWNTRMKMFMDIAGPHMDALSVHLYDGFNVTGQNNFRSGSNSEAILDLMEAYSFIKWGSIKDHAITEYGGIASGYGTDYSAIRQVQSVKSINHIIFNLLERENNIAISIPFITDKSQWHLTAANNYQPYGASLFLPTNLGQPNPAGWEYTSCIYFYELWKNVKGKRLDIATSDQDIQVQAFVKLNKMYVALNNLDDNDKTINLNFVKNLDGFQNLVTRSLKIYNDVDPVYTTNTRYSVPSDVTLVGGETAVLEFAFDRTLQLDNAIRSNKYYASTYLQPIAANTDISFAVNGVTTSAHGKATLRMSISRKHDVSKSPVVKVNGTLVSVPNNWKGYDQANRSDFFGTLEIPVPLNLIQASNTVTVRFPDAGGRISSVILNVSGYDNAPALPIAQGPYMGIAQSIPGILEVENFDTGGEGVAFHDFDVANLGGAHRNEAVDTKAIAEGGFLVGWTNSGEWMEYTVNIDEATEYDVDIRYVNASNVTGRIHIAIDGENLSGIIPLAPTGGDWATWATTSSKVTLPAGEHIIRVAIDKSPIGLDNITFSKATPLVDLIDIVNAPTSIKSSTELTFNIAYTAAEDRDLVVEFWSATNWLGQARKAVEAGVGNTSVSVTLSTAPPVGTGYIIKTSIRPTGGDWTTGLDTSNAWGIDVTEASQPFAGVAATVPGTVEAENYDLGGQGIAYNDADAANQGGAARTTEAVDLVVAPGGQAIGYTVSGEWLEYTVNFSTTQDYDFYPSIASPNTTGKLKISIDGIDVTGDVAVPNTGGLNTYQVMHIRDISVTAGTHIVRMQIVHSGFNLNRFSVYKSANTSKSMAEDINTTVSVSPNPATDGYAYVNFDTAKGAITGQIYSPRGKVIKNFTLTEQNSKIDLGNISSGIYLIRAFQGTEMTNKKLVVK